MLVPRGLPDYEEIKRIVGRLPEADLSAIQSWLAVLGTTGEVLAAFRPFFADYSLSQGRFALLMLLYRAARSEEETRRSLSPAELAEQAGVTRATITGLLDRLENEGYVQREHRRDDRRMVAVSLTPRGIELVETILPRHVQRVGILMSRLNQRERKQVISLMEKVREGASQLKISFAKEEKDV